MKQNLKSFRQLFLYAALSVALLSCDTAQNKKTEAITGENPQASLYWNDDLDLDPSLTDWFDITPQNIVNVCWSGVFMWDGGPTGGLDLDVPPDGIGDQFLGTWQSDTSAFDTEKAWAEAALVEQWEENSGIQFVFHSSCPIPIPTSFVPIRMFATTSIGGMGGLAWYGAGARLGDFPEIQGVDPEAEIQVGVFGGHPWSEAIFSSVVVHEMGHVLGAIHEHERPDRSSGACEDSLGFNANGVYLTEPYDPDSIMNYCRDIDNDGVGDGYTEDASAQLTPTDIAGIQALYTFPDSWKDDTTFFCQNSTETLYVGDSNGDNRDDLICYDSVSGALMVRLALADGTIGPMWNTILPFCLDPGSEILVLDLNGNGRDDLLCRNNNTGWLDAKFATEAGIYEELPAWRGPFSRWCTQPGDIVVAGNFNGDERGDLLCRQASGTLSIQYSALPEFPGEIEVPNVCTEAIAVDMGSDGNSVTVPANGCVMVRDSYPFWWGGSRTMNLQTVALGGISLPFAWSNSCSGGSGSGTFTLDGESNYLNATNSACATLIDLQGSASSTITIRYYGL